MAFAVAGDQQLTITSGEVSATASTTVGEAAQVVGLRVLMPRNVAVGLPVVAQVVAIDAEGRPVSGFDGTSDVTSSDPEATLPTSASFIRGVALVRIAFATLGKQTLTVTNPSDAEVTGSATTEVVELRLPGLPGLPPWRRG